MSAAPKKQKTAGTASLAAVAFDIDGVFKYGREWSPDGFQALQKLQAAGIPHVFVTNGGGGLLEATYATGFASKVKGAAATASGPDPLMSEENMILSYSPWKRALGAELANRRVLLVGDPREKVLQLAPFFNASTCLPNVNTASFASQGASASLSTSYSYRPPFSYHFPPPRGRRARAGVRSYS